MPIQRVVSKQAKTVVLLADPQLRRLVPESRAFNRRNVEELLALYGMVYVKPVVGTHGRGVIRVENASAAARPFRYQLGERASEFATFGEMYAALLQAKRPGEYLVQQGIDLLKYNNRRFDIRVMVQVNPSGRWISTGMLGRLAHPRKIITNYHAGGTPLPVPLLLQPAMPDKERAAMLHRLRETGTETARALSRRYPRLKELGIDIAVDSRLRVWIIEVNTKPDPYLFRKHPNPAVFRRIYRYARHYGGIRAR